MDPSMYFDRFMNPALPEFGICSAEDDDKGGAAGGGGTPAFSTEQRDELMKIVNGAQVTHATRIEKRFDAKLGEIQTSITSAMSEGFAKFEKKEDPPPPGGSGKKDGETEAMAQMRLEHEARMAEMDKKFEAERQLRVDEAEKAKVSEERGELTGALRKAGVPEGLVKGAAAALYVEDKRVGRDDGGLVVFKMQRDGYVDNLSLRDGIEEWLKSPEGKHYAPASGAGGSGATGGKPIAPGGKLTKAQEKRQAKRELMAAIIANPLN